MMKIFKSLFLLGLVLFGFSVFAEEAPALSEGMVNPGYHEKPEWFKESFMDFRDDLTEASERHKRVLLYFYQDGCPYCSKLLQDNFGDASIAKYAKENFDVIAINMWGDNEVVDVGGNVTTEKEFAKQLKVQFTPTLLFLNEEGKVLIRINGYFAPYKFLTTLKYVAERNESKVSIREYFKTLKPEKALGKLHDEINTIGEPLDLSKVNKPLVVMFEQVTCKACDELHLDVLKRKAVVESLKPYDVVVLNMWSDQLVTTPDGTVIKVSDWSKQLSIQYSPSMVFFNKQNVEVFRTEGYLRTFHIKAALEYVSSEAYKTVPEFQRYVLKIADDLHAKGIKYDLMD